LHRRSLHRRSLRQVVLKTVVSKSLASKTVISSRLDRREHPIHATAFPQDGRQSCPPNSGKPTASSPLHAIETPFA